MKLVFSICFTMILWSNLYATTHFYTDQLHYQQDSLQIARLPIPEDLEAFITQQAVNYTDGQHMKCIQGYRVWELRNDSLFLKELRNCNSEAYVNKDAQTMLDAKYACNEIFAHWVSTNIYNPYVERLYLVHERSVYEFDRDFEVKEGLLVQIKNYDNRASKQSDYMHNTDTLYHFLCHNINWQLMEKHACVSDETMLATFKVGQDAKPIDIKVFRTDKAQCKQEIKRLVEQLPEWDVYLKRGQPIDINWNLPINLAKLQAWKERQE